MDRGARRPRPRLNGPAGPTEPRPPTPTLQADARRRIDGRRSADACPTESNLSAFDVDLSGDERDRLDAASALSPDFSHGDLTPEVIQAAVFGGASVAR